MFRKKSSQSNPTTDPAMAALKDGFSMQGALVQAAGTDPFIAKEQKDALIKNYRWHLQRLLFLEGQYVGETDPQRRAAVSAQIHRLNQQLKGARRNLDVTSSEAKELHLQVQHELQQQAQLQHQQQAQSDQASSSVYPLDAQASTSGLSSASDQAPIYFGPDGLNRSNNSVPQQVYFYPEDLNSLSSRGSNNSSHHSN